MTCKDLIVFFPNVVSQNNYQDVDDEWRKVRRLNFTELELSDNMEIDKFWHKILQLKRCDDNLCFPNLKTLIMAILTIPVATACQQQAFSYKKDF